MLFIDFAGFIFNVKIVFYIFLSSECLLSPSFCPESYSTAQDVLNATQDRLAPRVRQILTGVAANTAESGTGRKRESEDGDMEGRGGEEGLEESAVKVNPGLRGVSQKLLEKVYIYIYI